MAVAPEPISRRRFLIGVGGGVVGGAALWAACTKGRAIPPGPGGGPSGSIQALTVGATQLSVLGTASDAPPMNPGRNRFGFDLQLVNGGLVQGGSPEVWVASSPTAKASGPIQATWHPFTGYQKTGDTSPNGGLTGVYVAEVDFPTAGNWSIGVRVVNGSKVLAGTGIIQVTSGPIPTAPGSKAISTPTPVATTDSAIEAICTRTPPDHLHAISLDQALKNGKPTAVSFATPLLCQSQLCGPVVDELILASESVGTKRANFIHVEEFLPGADHSPPPATLENQAPAFKAWGLQSEPWVFVIDKDGVIRFSSLGPVAADEIEAALQPLLS